MKVDWGKLNRYEIFPRQENVVMDYLERFLGVMEYQPVDQVPNWEAGVCAQTKDNWLA